MVGDNKTDLKIAVMADVGRCDFRKDISFDNRLRSIGKSKLLVIMGVDSHLLAVLLRRLQIFVTQSSDLLRVKRRLP